MHTLKISRIEWAVYAMAFAFLSFFIFKVNDDTIPLIKLLNWQYAIPVGIYAGMVMLFVIGISQLFKSILRKSGFAVTIGVVVGSISGFKAIWFISNWFFS